jgi:hypothetical protein
MKEVTAGRTLVKSPPELWAVCSDADALAQHLEVFGEIRITRLEPETTVAWEGDRASGTVRLEPAGWGTKVTVTASATEAEQALPETEPVSPDPEPVARRRFFARLFGGGYEPVSEPAAPPSEPDVVQSVLDSLVALEAALDNLGQAHKRPFSR